MIANDAKTRCLNSKIMNKTRVDILKSYFQLQITHGTCLRQGVTFQTVTWRQCPSQENGLSNALVLCL